MVGVHRALQHLCLLFVLLSLAHASETNDGCDEGSMQTQDCEVDISLPDWVWVIVAVVISLLLCCFCAKAILGRDRSARADAGTNLTKREKAARAAKHATASSNVDVSV